MLKFAFEQTIVILILVTDVFFASVFCIFSKFVVLGAEVFFSVLGKFSKFKVFFVQKQSFLCSKAKICSKVERFVIK